MGVKTWIAKNLNKITDAIVQDEPFMVAHCTMRDTIEYLEPYIDFVKMSHWQYQMKCIHKAIGECDTRKTCFLFGRLFEDVNSVYRSLDWADED